MKELQCGEVWIGNRNIDIPFETAGVNGIVFSKSAAGETGGDLYFLSVCDGNIMTRVLLGDVAGHGEKISHISKYFYDSLTQMKNNFNNSDFLHELNQMMTLEIDVKKATTVALISFFKTDRSFSYCYAGHPPSFFIKRNEEKSEWKKALLPKTKAISNLPVGLIRNLEFKEEKIQLEKGDRIFIYSDGVTETPVNGNHLDMFNDDNLKRILDLKKDAALEEIKDSLLAELRSFSNSDLEHDDITFIALEAK